MPQFSFTLCLVSLFHLCLLQTDQVFLGESVCKDVSTDCCKETPGSELLANDLCVHFIPVYSAANCSLLFLNDCYYIG